MSLQDIDLALAREARDFLRSSNLSNTTAEKIISLFISQVGLCLGRSVEVELIERLKCFVFYQEDDDVEDLVMGFLYFLCPLSSSRIQKIFDI